MNKSWINIGENSIKGWTLGFWGYPSTGYFYYKWYLMKNEKLHLFHYLRYMLMIISIYGRTQNRSEILNKYETCYIQSEYRST